jgi:hypothetical protein
VVDVGIVRILCQGALVRLHRLGGLALLLERLGGGDVRLRAVVSGEGRLALRELLLGERSLEIVERLSVLAPVVVEEAGLDLVVADPAAHVLEESHLRFTGRFFCSVRAA